MNEDSIVTPSEYKKTEKYKKWKREYDKRYKAENLEKFKAYQEKYRVTEAYKDSYFAWNLSTDWPELSSQEAKQRYFKILNEQDGKCAICKNQETRKHKGKLRNLSVDHCHATGIVRGLLCSRCNISIGKFEDNSELLRSAADYLDKKEAK